AIDPVTPNTLYAGFLGGPGSHIYKTTDGADNWTTVGTDTPDSPVSLTVDPHNHTTIYAANSSSAGGAFKSVDGGVTWQTVGLNQTGPFAQSVIVSPVTPGLLFAQTNQGLFKSVDDGVNWTPMTTPRSGKIVLDPVSATTIYLLTQFDGLF